MSLPGIETVACFESETPERGLDSVGLGLIWLNFVSTLFGCACWFGLPCFALLRLLFAWPWFAWLVCDPLWVALVHCRAVPCSALVGFGLTFGRLLLGIALLGFALLGSAWLRLAWLGLALLCFALFCFGWLE